MPTLPIAGLVEASSHLAAANRAIAAALGTWVASTSDPQLQRLFALAGHRHAWHAELWDERRPTVPLEGDEQPVTMPDAADDTTRRATYVEIVERFSTSLALMSDLVDPTLDPATARVIALVSADLRELLALVSL
jgi:hypothetical protein